jgi:hypothetical protein
MLLIELAVRKKEKRGNSLEVSPFGGTDRNII